MSPRIYDEESHRWRAEHNDQGPVADPSVSERQRLAFRERGFLTVLVADGLPKDDIRLLADRGPFEPVRTPWALASRADFPGEEQPHIVKRVHVARPGGPEAHRPGLGTSAKLELDCEVYRIWTTGFQR